MTKAIHNIIACLFFGLLLSSCVEEVLDNGMSGGEGRLLISDINVISEVGDVHTKAAIDASIIPLPSDFTIKVLRADTKELVKSLTKGETYCFLPAGSYIVIAENGNEIGMSEIPYFYAEDNSVTIVEGQDVSVNLKATLNCAIITPQISAGLVEHYELYTLTITEDVKGAPSHLSGLLENNKDFFVRGGADRVYNLQLSGTNKIGEPVSHDWPLVNLVPRTRYHVNCDPDLPVFTLPVQEKGDVWSKFAYITPVSANNISALAGMSADKIINGMVYEASSDNGQTWKISAKTNDGRYVIKDLLPSTTYKVRSRYGAVLSSNTHTIVTEVATPLRNGNMEEWTSTKVYGGNGTWSADIFCDYASDWSTRNEKTVDGAQGANGTGNYAVNWRWCSGTSPSDDMVEGKKAAQISTLAFYNKNVWGSWKRNSVYNYTRDNGTAYVGYLFTGTFDKATDKYTLGIPHNSRPVSISFDYKYAPVALDKCIAYAKLYDSAKNEIATTVTFNSSTQDVYKREKLRFTYSDQHAAAAYIGVFFQSGTDTNIQNMKQSEGNYNTTPWVWDRVVGSVLKIDNVVLNYDYE